MRRIFFLLFCSLIGTVYAEGKFVTIQKDVDVASLGHKKICLYANSTLPLVNDSIYIKVTEVNTTNVQAKQKNKNGKVVVGAVFPVITDNKEPNEVTFKDSADEKRVNINIKFDYVFKAYYLSDTIILYKKDVSLSNVVDASKSQNVKSIITHSSRINQKTGNLELGFGKYSVKKIIVGDSKPQIVDADSTVIYNYSRDPIYVIFEEDIPDIIIDGKDFDVYMPQEDNTFLDSIFEYWYIILFIMIVGGFSVWYFWPSKESQGDEDVKSKGMKDKKNKVEEVKESLDNTTNDTMSVQDIENRMKVIADNLKKSIEKKIEIEVLKVKSSSDNAGKMAKLEEHSRTLEEEINKLSKQIRKAEEESKTWETKEQDYKRQIEALNQQIEQAASVPSDVLVFSNTGSFLPFSQGIISLCQKAESEIFEYVKGLSEENKERIQCFLAAYSINTPNVLRDRWCSVIEGLNVSGYIKDKDLFMYMKNQSEQERIAFMQKHFFEDVLCDWLSSLIVLMETLRNHVKFGVLEKPSADFSKTIKELISLSAQHSIEVGYFPLFENLKDEDYDKVEISESLPKSVEKILNDQPQGQPLYVAWYAVNSNVSDRMHKTQCVVKI